MNYEPPVSFMPINKWYCKLLFTLSLVARFYPGLTIVILYWVMVYSVDELVGMYVIGFIGKVVMLGFA